MIQKILRFTHTNPSQAERTQRNKRVIELGKKVAKAADFDGSIEKRE